jgi:hypothetical protein
MEGTIAIKGLDFERSARAAAFYSNTLDADPYPAVHMFSGKYFPVIDWFFHLPSSACHRRGSRHGDGAAGIS